MFPEEKLNKIKVLFDSFSESDFAEILIGEIFNVDRLENFNLDLFSRVILQEKLPAVLSLTVKNIRESFLGDKQKLKKKIDHLFSYLSEPDLAEIYRNAFSELLNSISAAKGFSFDHDLIKVNYRLIILWLFLCEADKETLSLITKEITQELEKMSKGVDFEYLTLLVDFLKKREETAAGKGSPAPEDLVKLVTTIIENSCWDVSSLEDFQRFIDYPQSSVLGAAFYLENIFAKRRISSAALKLFLKFFPQDIRIFYEHLGRCQADIELIEKIIAIFKTLDKKVALPMLEQLYLFSNTYIKIEIIRAMRELGSYRKEFLIDILLKGEIPLKQEVLSTLIKDEKTKEEILEAFFTIDNPWRINGKALLANIRVIEELDMRDAKDYLLTLNKKLFFWHWNLKREIKNILNKWN